MDQGSAERDERAVFAARARRLGLAFADDFDAAVPSGGHVPAAAVREGSFARAADGRAFLAPPADLRRVRQWLDTYPGASDRLAVATPSAIRRALTAAGADSFADAAEGRLHEFRPDLSARQVVTPRQGAVLAVLGLAAAICFAVMPAAGLLLVHALAATFFFLVSALRFLAATYTAHRRLRPPPLFDAAAAGANCPAYTVLVPLYGEAAMAGDIVAALRRLDWPADRLDIKLIVEEDDRATVAAVERVLPGPPFEMVVVPPRGPRTKPKALSFALPFARGDFVTVYDAEDRPHPSQLREAAAAFAADPGLSCVQAPLLISNTGRSWIARLFAIEYAALFDGLLPTLAVLGLPLPLGGTSNHFRLQDLVEIGGWDPYNVTEDADLGIRLARFGCRAGTITLPTLEEAPVTPGPWMRQRTRWFKGWMQTWLVHMRHPLDLTRALGLQRMAGFNLVTTGMIVSALIHPFYLALFPLAVIWPGLLIGDGGAVAAAFLGIGLFNLAAGYAAMALLSANALALRGRRRLLPWLLGLPVYWLMMSLATYRALLHLVLCPFLWEKTPHQRRSAPAGHLRPVAEPAGGAPQEASARRGAVTEVRIAAPG